MTRLRILSIIFSLLILIGAGHGIGPLVLFEIMGVREILLGDFQFNITGRYEERLMAVALMSLVGQSTLLMTFFLEKIAKSTLTIVGSVVLLTAIGILTQDFIDEGIDRISLVFCLPSIVTAVMLLIRGTMELIKQRNSLTSQ